MIFVVSFKSWSKHKLEKTKTTLSLLRGTSFHHRNPSARRRLSQALKEHSVIHGEELFHPSTSADRRRLAACLASDGRRLYFKILKFVFYWAVEDTHVCCVILLMLSGVRGMCF